MQDDSIIPIDESKINDVDDDQREIFRKSHPPNQANFSKKQPNKTFKVVRSKPNHDNSHSASMINNRSGISKVARKDLYNKGIV